MGIRCLYINSYVKTEGEHTFTIAEGSGSRRVMTLSGASRTYSHTAEPRFVKKAENSGSGGSGLPNVTQEDATKLLEVNSSGEWEASTYPVSYNEEILYSNTFTITQEMIDEDQNSVDLSDTSLASADFSTAENWIVTINGNEAEYVNRGRGEYNFNTEDGDLEWEYADGTLYGLRFRGYSAGEYTLLVKDNATIIDPRFSQAVTKATGLETFEGSGYLSDTFGVNGVGEWVPTPLATLPTESRDTLFAAIYVANNSVKEFIPILDVQSVPSNSTLIYALSVHRSGSQYSISGEQIPDIPVLTRSAGSGTYVLKGTVTNNNVTLEWVRES